MAVQRIVLRAVKSWPVVVFICVSCVFAFIMLMNGSLTKQTVATTPGKHQMYEDYSDQPHPQDAPPNFKEFIVNHPNLAVINPDIYDERGVNVDIKELLGKVFIDQTDPNTLPKPASGQQSEVLTLDALTILL